jgi:hypothetical protein
MKDGTLTRRLAVHCDRLTRSARIVVQVPE